MLAGGLRRGMAGLLLGLAGALAAVVPPTGILPANAQSTGEFFDYPQTLLNGTVSATVSVPLKSCRNLCFARSGCIGFDYSSSDGVCRLFANVAGAGESPPHIAGTRSLVMGYRPPANPPVAAQPTSQPSQGASEAEATKQKSATSQKTGKPAAIVRAKPRRKKQREATSQRPAAKSKAASPDPTSSASTARPSKFRICNNHFGTFSVLASRKCPLSGPGSF
ncbi:PAN domain-containing protein [Mesorhizobium opportunistum]|uniref:PAN domain-containing protein n=1 Tax=Mesorhizobium TaxID=68287 RepID=UPI001FDA208F|nr:PAN domain-containing protein [Mesorhizobium sp. LNHC229A00]